ncbi:biotin-dependent carboxyltransferase family protein [Flavobacteriaceae bacterium S356]|uniref:Biotin-dependent carboxyltransferase family protein n=1 Tax=Asprobacillus argus TaxID=3076534 RepID=A0ABU3LF89_9FLAO|nr:biotin-dependent carboxyltransferase family protein [Flavobacteriaceae bacterium S356]
MDMIKVVHAGVYNTIQDVGRIGFTKNGIPQGGSMDTYSAEMANILLKNNSTSAVVEITFGQGKFEFTSGAFICLMGGDFSPKINRNSIQMNTVVEVKKKDVLSFGRRNYGARVYLAIQGGIQSEIVLKSRSFLMGITQLKLLKGDTLKINSKKPYSDEGFSKLKIYQDHFQDVALECFPGPEFDQLNNKQKERLFQSFTVSEDNNRVGYRLNELVENNLSSILTSAVLPGTVQLTPSGKLIVLMRDCQVTGGYPRVLQLSEYAISRLSQKVAGDSVKFMLQK